MKRSIFLIFILLFTSLECLAEQISVIVNEQNPVESISRTQLNDYYLKKTKEWPSGQSVKFFDRGDGSSERHSFLKSFVRKSQREIELYWIGQKLYTGNSAPTQIPSETMLAALVSRFPGAISYVSESFPGAKGVKKIKVTE